MADPQKEARTADIQPIFLLEMKFVLTLIDEYLRSYGAFLGVELQADFDRIRIFNLCLVAFYTILAVISILFDFRNVYSRIRNRLVLSRKIPLFFRYALISSNGYILFLSNKINSK